MKYFEKKEAAVKKIQETGGGVLCNHNVTKFFICGDHQEFLQTIVLAKRKNFYESISATIPVPLFFDVEIYTGSEYFETPTDILTILFDKITNKFPDYKLEKYILESHNETKRSFHIICNLSLDNNIYLFKDVRALKELHQELRLDIYRSQQNKYIIDPSVYREGLFRTIHSSKFGEHRPLIKSETSDNYPSELYTFVSYYNTLDHKIIEYESDVIDIDVGKLNLDRQDREPQELDDKDRDIIQKFVRKEYRHPHNKIRDIFVDREHNCLVVSLDEKYCDFIERDHKSNNQYIVIDATSAKQKCHDTDCQGKFYHEIKLQDENILQLVKKCLRISKEEEELINKAIDDCKKYISETWDTQVSSVSFDKNAMTFRSDASDQSSLVRAFQGTCPQCKLEHHISDAGYCLKCSECNAIFPKKPVMTADNTYAGIVSFYKDYRQLFMNNVINININNITNYGNFEDDFTCDVKLDPVIIKDKKLRAILNECLDGHKVTKMAELMSMLYKDYVFTGNDWFFFDGHKYIADNKSINFKINILDLCKTFNKIKAQYEQQQQSDIATNMIKNIKSLTIKLNKPQLKDDIIKEAQLFYNDNSFISKLNSKKHLVPFNNGVFDLLENKFRKTKKDDYINFTVGFDYDKKIQNTEVVNFVNNILPKKGVRDFVLKKMSECLNGDIPNTNFLMFIGDGANGKSQLLNLMKVVMGEFGEKVEVTLLTRKRNNANEANTEKIKLLNKRFAFLSEPEDGEKINIGLLKELTGSEEIVARGLYQEAVSFVMEAKLFLACNELPEIKGEDTALWRRIRVIDFPSRFVDTPKESNEYKIDRTLPSRMREDLSWRQTFMNMLLDYYNRDVPIPEEVQIKTNEYRQENSEFYTWLEDNVEYKQDQILKLDDVCQLYIGKKVGPRIMTKHKKEIEKYVKEKYKNLNFEYQKGSFNDQHYRGWLHLAVKDF